MDPLEGFAVAGQVRCGDCVFPVFQRSGARTVCVEPRHHELCAGELRALARRSGWAIVDRRRRVADVRDGDVTEV